MPRQNGTRPPVVRAHDIAEIDELMTRTDHVKRAGWADVHALRLLTMLSSPPLSEVPQRIWRLRFFQNDEYVVASLGASTKSERAHITVVHGYNNPAVVGHSGPTTVVHLDLMAGYSTDEIVAFLRLDLVDPDTIDWRDDTHYYKIAIAGADVVGSLLGKVAD